MNSLKKLNIDLRRIVCFSLIAAIVFLSSGITAFGADEQSQSAGTSQGSVLTDSEGIYAFEIKSSPVIGQNGTVSVKHVTETRTADDPGYGYFVVPESVSVDSGTFDVIGIEAEAFKDVKDIKGVVIPDSVIEISETAFALKTNEQKSDASNAAASDAQTATSNSLNDGTAIPVDGQSSDSQSVTETENDVAVAKVQTVATSRQVPIYCNEGSAAKSFADAQNYEVHTDVLKIVTASDAFKVGEVMVAEIERPEFINSDVTVSWSVSDEKIATIDDSGNITGVAPGEVTINAKVCGLVVSKTVKIESSENTESVLTAENNVQSMSDGDASVQTQAQNPPAITYQAHYENYGWIDTVTNGVVSGFTGTGIRLEGLRIGVQNSNDLGVTYQAHVQDIGWQNWVNTGQDAGTTGRCLRLEAVKIKLTGAAADNYSVCYRVYVHNFGWLNWVKDGDTSGTTGLCHQIEGIQIVLRDKNAVPLPTDKFSSLDKETIRESTQLTYRSHVQDIGWLNYVDEGKTSGTTGQARRLEAFDVNLSGLLVNDNIEYRSYVYERDWQGWASAGNMTGTTGQCRQIQAIQIRLTDSAEILYDVYYRTHVSDIGWMGWAKNGENAGTTGSDNRVEAIEIKLVPKNGAAPGSTKDAYRVIQRTNYIDRIVNTANSQVGYVEVFDWTKYGQWYQDLFNAPGFSTTEWCAMFVSWCASESGVPQHIFPYHAYCPTGRQWFISRGLYQRNGYVPKAGDVVYFDWDYDDDVDHVGLVVGYDPSSGHVTTVEGNTGNGPGVERHTYPYTWGYINGFGLPQYDAIR